MNVVIFVFDEKQILHQHYYCDESLCFITIIIYELKSLLAFIMDLYRHQLKLIPLMCV